MRLATEMTHLQFITIVAITILLAIAVVLWTVHLGDLIAEEFRRQPRLLILVPGLLEIVGYFFRVPELSHWIAVGGVQLRLGRYMAPSGHAHDWRGRRSHPGNRTRM